MPVEVFVPLSCPMPRVPRATHGRGTLLVSTRRALRTRGFEERYLEALGPSRVAIESSIASSWVPIDLMLTHYGACDALGLDRATLDGIGAESGKYIFTFLASIVVRLSVEAGATPWSVLGNVRRFIDRTWKGSEIEVLKLGPKEARVTWCGQPCARVPYFRHAWGGFLGAVLEPFCQKVHPRLLSSPADDFTLAHRFSWV